ncbi:MFS alpha-glucoside transporter [Colletotrichum truncatum]|uniref:MFS alpha-glucoside transporter n=1 Tax=Colletotrichum truncatum TaxID=5467 RepID=A0ACC3YYN9_COLTU|nr:MFS alpha-glucoside transporter [Colletotrichum truncatum]KAF6781802.1 MFS alpha-glucoside transporter [Colletotrichum truncatum]
MADTEKGQPQSLAKARSKSFDHNEYGAYTPDVALIEAAAATSTEEAKLPRKELFSRYWPAVVYSTLLSMALVMEGMDVGLINNFFAQRAYKEKFGWPDASGKMHISASWQAGIGNGQNLGSIIGLLLNGWLQSRFGSRKVYMGAMATMGGTIFLLFFAVNVQMLLAANVLCGIPWGIFQTLTTAYAAEICPAALRGYLTAWVSMCWGAGSFLAAGVLRGALDLPDGDLRWKIPYALQWVWVVPLFIVGFLAPESPWYLIRRGRLAEAEKSLTRLARKNHYTEETMAQTLAFMRHTNEMEKIEAEGATYKDCFHGTNLRRTGIVCMAWIIQILNGQSICSYAALFLQAAGMPEVQSFNFSMGIQSVNIVGTGIAIMLMGRIGRRTFFFYGSSVIGLAMLIIGILGFIPGQKNISIAVAVVMIIVNLTFKLSLGPTTYVIVGETPSSRVRAQTIVLGRAIYVCGQIAVVQLNPRMLTDNPDAWNWGAKTGLFYFGLCLIWAVWIFFFLPETKNRSFGELDYLFQKKVPARKFETATVDLFEFTGGDKLAEPVEDTRGEKRD